MNRLFFIAAVLLLGSTTTAPAQEYLDTAGRWKQLMLPGGPVGATQLVPRSMAAFNGRVVIGRELRRMIVSADSGETWRTVDDGLPAGVSTVWTMVFPEPSQSPLWLLGVAVTVTREAVLIESTDGGVSWSQLSRLPELDPLFAASEEELRMSGPPVFQFLARSGGVLRGFLSSAAGLLASSDGGRTWTRRGEPLAIRSLEMQDDLNGVAALGAYRDSGAIMPQAGGIFWTTDGGVTWTDSYRFPDGGFYQWIEIAWFGGGSYHAFIPYRFQQYLDWQLMRSSDAGRTWRVHYGRQARRPMYGFSFFRDSTDFHVVGDGAILSHSADGGDLFYVLRDTTRTFWQTPLDDIPGYITKAPVAAHDGKYIYMTVPGNRAARWRMAGVEPLSSVKTESEERTPALYPNPVIGTHVTVETGSGTGPCVVEVVDVAGRTLRRYRTPAHEDRITLETGDLESGMYRLVLTRDGARRTLPLVIR